ncbi:hypothetical protein DVH26_07760 [Paenibacillus sp. H1-7]|uniref:hypothetical protein n=1 Tax=Paenibacillus sp. H1-7 TaxID=2282849 RepID=UPI001EF805B8|nr:hypothetical protein [Paenibacillus sp. H1-7]ULL14353.1 hypothetical protein DVH26_07760 [Paenibacillus sp. H1-7]
MDEDMILPDDYVDTQPQDNEPDVELQEFEHSDSEETDLTGEDTKPPVEDVDPNQELTTQSQKVKIKFNHEEREIDLEEAAALAQKGMNYDKAVERARAEAAQQARDAVIADMGMTWNDKPITTESEYKQALAEQDLINKYKDRDLPPEVIQELVESRRDREERQREKAAKEVESKQQDDFDDFFRYFESVNERKFDSEKDKLPQEVVDAVNNGQSLKYAYMEHHNKELRNRLKIASQNQANVRRAPVGSITAGGGTITESEDPFLLGFNEE